MLGRCLTLLRSGLLDSASFKRFALGLSQLFAKKETLIVMGGFSALKLRLQVYRAKKAKALEKIEGLELLSRKAKSVGFNCILRVAYKDRASRIKLEKLAKVLHKIIPRKLVKQGLDSILNQGRVG